MAKKNDENRITMFKGDTYLEVFKKRINKFGTGAKIDAPKRYLGKRVIVLVKK